MRTLKLTLFSRDVALKWWPRWKWCKKSWSGMWRTRRCAPGRNRWQACQGTGNLRQRGCRFFRMLIMETSKLHTSCYYCLQHAHIEILAQTYLIYFPAEHTAADEDQEEENLRLCNILQVQKASWFDQAIRKYHLIINLVSIVGSMQLRTQGCNFQTSANRSLSGIWLLLILRMTLIKVIWWVFIIQWLII